MDLAPVVLDDGVLRPRVVDRLLLADDEELVTDLVLTSVVLVVSDDLDVDAGDGSELDRVELRLVFDFLC